MLKLNVSYLCQVKKCLWVLIQHNIVTFTLDPVGQVKYSANLTNIQARTRFFKYISCTKALFCDGAELIIKELARQGQMEMNEVIETVSEQLLNSPAHSYQGLILSDNIKTILI